MDQTFFEITWENAPVITCVIVAVLASIFITSKIVRFYGRFEGLETKVGHVETKLGEFKEEVKSKFEKVESDLTYLKNHAHATDMRLAVMDAKLDSLIEKMNFLIDGHPLKRTR
jgi:hypothetical protein